MEPIVHPVFESQSCTWQYIVADPSTKAAIIIDPVLDFDLARNAVSTKTADNLLVLVKENGYIVERLLETHAHADHLTAAKYLQDQMAKHGRRPEVGIGKRIREVQERFAKRYGINEHDYEDAFDTLFEDNEIFYIGELEAKAVHLPGHTPDHMGYLVGGTSTSQTPVRPHALTALQAIFFAATPSSTPTSAPPVAIFPAATPTTCALPTSPL